MKKYKTLIGLISFILIMVVSTIVFFILYKNSNEDIFIYLYVTCLTISYHFIMRVMVGEFYQVTFKNRDFHYNAYWYKLHGFEKKLYRFLRINRLKRFAITARPEQFDLKERSMEEILHSMTQAELVHETIMVLSFIPLLFIIPYGKPLVFILTSIFACLCDSFFVMIQRWNRPKIMRILNRKR